MKSDLKDFLELIGLSGLTRGDLFPQVRIDLEEFFLGEVVRIEKELVELEEEFYGCRIDVGKQKILDRTNVLEGRLGLAKELAGVEQK